MNITFNKERNCLVIESEVSFDTVELAKAVDANPGKVTRRQKRFPGRRETGWNDILVSEFTIQL